MNPTMLGLALVLGLALYFGYNNWNQQEATPTKRPTSKRPSKNGNWNQRDDTPIERPVPKLPTKNGITKHGLDCTKSEDGPCRVDDTSIRFWIIGDWGGKTKPPFTTGAQIQCASLMYKKSKQKAPQFVVSIGDNFYERGVKSVTDPRWQAAWDNIFLYGKKERLPWYVTLGNHDYYGNVQAQVDYSFKNDRWVCDHNFVVSYNAQPKGPSVDLIFMDTVIMCGNTPDKGKERALSDDDEGEYDADDDPHNHAEYDVPEDPAAAQRMWDWLEEKLAESKADYLFVVGHYPAIDVVSAVSHCLMPRLQELMETYHVTAYLTGHEHSLQHLTTISRVSGEPIHHVVSGGAHKLKTSYDPHFEGEHAWNVWKADCPFFHPMVGVLPINKTETFEHGGVVYAEMNSEAGFFEYYDCSGKMRFPIEFKPRPARRGQEWKKSNVE